MTEFRRWYDFETDQTIFERRDGSRVCPGCADPKGFDHWPSCGNQNVFSYPRRAADPGVALTSMSDEGMDFPPCGGVGG